jgi:hypothetical protein
MMYPTADDDCDPCTASASYLARRVPESASLGTLLWSSLPFITTWLLAALLAWYRLFPLLCGDARPAKDALPQHNRDREAGKGAAARRLTRPSSQKLASVVFATRMGLSAVLVVLLMCEISDSLYPAARGLTLKVTLRSLLVLSILVTPALELHRLAKTLLGSPADISTKRAVKPIMRITLEVALFAAWLIVFWYIP